MNDEEYILVKKKVREMTKVDLDNYGTNQMKRRLESFITRSKSPTLAEYFKLLEEDAKQLEKLRDFLTINVSEFFRDTAHFSVLQDVILPELLNTSKVLNIWSAGCSNGGEPYSVAMLLDMLSPGIAHRILATDIDTAILERATAGGPYHQADIRNVPKFMTLKYFNCRNNEYWVNDDIRRRVIFRQHDMTRNPFETSFDLIMCRNVVIYFSDEAKKKLKKHFFDSLKNSGILFIGGTETMLDASNLGFQRLYPCFYRKTAGPVQNPPVQQALTSGWRL
jgi:chemotaxis protein methyltransferase CheR